MQKFIDFTGYGNKDIDGGIDLFWLQGDLRITPQQQIDFLIKLHTDSLPFSKRTLDIVKDIMIFEKTDDYILRAKTGWAMRFNPGIGWFVGYVERENDFYFFAMNININKNEDTEARISITKNILKELKIIE